MALKTSGLKALQNLDWVALYCPHLWVEVLRGGGRGETGDPLRFIRPAVGTSPADPRGLMKPPPLQIRRSLFAPHCLSDNIFL